MTEANESKVRWFLENLELLVEDFDFEGEGRAFSFYFDTADVSYALTGMDSFRSVGQPGFETRPRFDYPSTLVGCLLADGWIGPFGLLPPHEAEFRHGLNQDFGVGRPPSLAERDVQLFIQNLSLADSKSLPSKPLTKMSAAELLDFVRQNARRAADVFKAIQFIKLAWPDRLTHWVKDGLFISKGLTHSSINYHSLVASETFEKMYATLRDNRPQKGPANFSDAMAMAILARKIEDLRESHSGEVPRFFVSTPIWQRVFQDAGVEQHFEYENLQGKTSSALRGADYFVFRAVFQSVRSTSSPEENYRPIFTTKGQIRDLRDDLKVLVESQDPLTDEVINEVAISGRSLTQLIDDIKCFSFFENVWQKVLAEKDAKNVLHYLKDAAELFTRKKFRNGVEKALRETKRNLAASVDRYEQVALLWDKLKKAARDFSKATEGELLDEASIWLDLGLVTFGVRDEIFEDLKGILGRLKSSRDKRQEEEALGRIVQYIGVDEGSYSDPRETKLCAAVLWALRLDEIIAHFLQNPGVVKDAGLLAMEAATFLRARELRGKAGALKVTRIVHHLEGEFENNENIEDKARLGCQLAYILFRMWRRKGGCAQWRFREDGLMGRMGRSQRKLRNDTLRYSATAAVSGVLPRIQAVYSMNQYLFYLVEMGGDEQLGEMKRVASELLEYSESEQEMWSFRYDDTLARYYHRLARRSKDANKREALIERAKRFSDKAVESGRGNRRVEGYNGILVQEYAS